MPFFSASDELDNQGHAITKHPLHCCSWHEAGEPVRIPKLPESPDLPHPRTMTGLDLPGNGLHALLFGLSRHSGPVGHPHDHAKSQIYESATAPDAWSRGLALPNEESLDQERGEQLGSQAAQANLQAAVAIWQAVIAGRWSLVAHFDSDEHRCFVARKNAAAGPGASTLSARERQIVASASLGHANKLIAYELGLCSSTVAAQITSAARKLGISSRTLLHASAVLGGGGPERGNPGDASNPPVVRCDAPTVRVTRFVHDEQDFAVIRIVIVPKLPPSLTTAEREVARLVIEGLSDAGIAARRRTSVRTVANQLRSIYTKLAVGSRRQLCSRFSVQ
jgi:DNA-binding NarL/FixJ family response regulator